MNGAAEAGPTPKSGSVVGVVLAGGRSMGFPKRDLAVVGGWPLVVRAIRALRRADVDRVVVGTEDPQVAQVAQAAGAAVVTVRRTATDDVALLEVLDTLPDGDPDVVVLVGCACPFTSGDDVAGVLDLVRVGGFDCGLAVAPSRERLWHVQGTGVNHDPALPHRAQARDLQFRETGSAYAMRVARLREHRRLFFGHVGLHEVSATRAMTIETLEDLEAAHQLAPIWDDNEPIDVDAVVTDFDGAHVDDRTVLMPDGSEGVVVRRSDGQGVRALLARGVRVLLLSGDPTRVAGWQAARLGTEIAHHGGDRAAALAGWLQWARLDPARTAYLGSDVHDLRSMAMIGWPIAVRDAHPEVLASARIVLPHTAGGGAVRELADRVLGAARGVPN